MSSSPSNSKKKVAETGSYIKKTNPEVFQIQPRPGGIIPISTNDKTSIKIEEVPEEKSFKRQPSYQLDEKISKEFRVQVALDETESFDFEDATFPNPIKDAMYMFGVTISSLILMAANHPNIPNDYLAWTTHCLENIKDDFGNRPPNVQGILNHMKLNKMSGGDAPTSQGGNDFGGPGSPGEDEEGEPTIKTTTRVKLGQSE